MKINKSLLVLALGLSVATVQAGPFLLDPGTSSLATMSGAPGTKTAVVEIGGVTGTVGTVYHLDSVVVTTTHGITGSSSFSPVAWTVGSPNSDVDYDVTITIPASGVTVGNTYLLPAVLDYTIGTSPTLHTESIGNIAVTIGTPEPAQTVAGAMLLGCGGLIFAGRRLFKKQAA